MGVRQSSSTCQIAQVTTRFAWLPVAQTPPLVCLLCASRFSLQSGFEPDQLGETQGDLLRSWHCTLKLNYLFAAIPVIVFFFLPGAAVLAKSTLVSRRLPGARPSVVGLSSSLHLGPIVSNASGDLPLGWVARVFPVNVSSVQNLVRRRSWSPAIASPSPTATSTATVTPPTTVADRSSVYLPSINAP